MNNVSALPVPSSGLLRVVTPGALNQADAAASQQTQDPEVPESALAAHIRGRMQEMRNFRNTEGIAERITAALRTYKGQYDPSTLAAIRQFGGSEVYARVTPTKARGATALLRDIYLSSERPWDLDPTPVPTVPDSIDKAINDLVNVEVSTMQAQGQQVDQQMIADRVQMLRAAAEKAAKKQAQDEADRAADKVEDILREGNFYEAFAEFLADLPIFPFAVIKGPVVRRVSQIKWVNGSPQKSEIPRMCWYRVSPFDLYWSAGASNPMEAEFIERIRLTRTELMNVRGLPGYNSAAIDEVLKRFHDRGFREWWDVSDAERARLEEREQWPRGNSALIDTVEYHGTVSGTTLRDWGMTEQQVPDPLRGLSLIHI